MSLVAIAEADYVTVRSKKKRIRPLYSQPSSGHH